MAQGARSTPSLRWPTGLRGIGGAWKRADLRPFRLVRGLSRIPNTALPCLDPSFASFSRAGQTLRLPVGPCGAEGGHHNLTQTGTPLPLIAPCSHYTSHPDCRSARNTPPAPCTSNLTHAADVHVLRCLAGSKSTDFSTLLRQLRRLTDCACFADCFRTRCRFVGPVD